MKKILTYVLLLAMLVSVFAGCGNEGTSEESGAADLELAKAFLKEKYRTFPTETKTSYNRINSVKGGNTTFAIEWTVEGAGDAYEVVKGETETTLNFKLETNATEINYTLKATLKAENGTTGEVAFNYTIPVIEKTPIVADPKADTAYKFGISQTIIGKNLYFTGEMDSYYLATSEDYAAAVDVYLEAKDDGFALYFNKDGKKNYVNIVERDDSAGSKTIKIEETANCVYKFDSTAKTLIATIAFSTGTVEDFYLGTYSTYSTISSSKTSYITGENAAKIGIEQFPAYLISGEFSPIASNDDTSEEPSSEDASSEDASTDASVDTSVEEPSSEATSKEEPSSEEVSKEEPSSEDASSEDTSKDEPKDGYKVVSSPKADTAYKLALTQANKGTDLYFTGEMDGFYLAMSENKADAIDVSLEAKDGGFAIYFKKGGSKTYINIVERDDAAGKVTIRLEDTAKSVYKMDSATKVFITPVNFADGTTGDFYLGTYKTFVTISPSNTSYITGDNASKIGVEQFPAYIVTI